MNIRLWCDGSLTRSLIELFLVPVIELFAMTGVTKAVICDILSVGYKRFLVHVVVAAGFPTSYLSSLLPYAGRHINVNKMC